MQENEDHDWHTCDPSQREEHSDNSSHEYGRASTFMREVAASDDPPEELKHPGSIEIETMTTADGADLLPALAFVAPDDDNEKDRTLARVQLPAAVQANGELALRMTFKSTLPRVMSRTGWAGDPDKESDLFFMVAQWFPKIAVLRQTPEGELHWNAHQFHWVTEFFADYGEFEPPPSDPIKR